MTKDKRIKIKLLVSMIAAATFIFLLIPSITLADTRVNIVQFKLVNPMMQSAANNYEAEAAIHVESIYTPTYVSWDSFISDGQTSNKYRFSNNTHDNTFIINYSINYSNGNTKSKIIGTFDIDPLGNIINLAAWDMSGNHVKAVLSGAANNRIITLENTLVPMAAHGITWDL